ncbi:MAG: prepilin-type N-terminal cleavage/methylation domain-containing protein [Fimbriimonadaceae bacterium]
MRKNAFTLVEIMVVCSIIMVLSGLTFTIMAPAREQGRQTHCVSNLKQIYNVWAMYSTDYAGGPTFPGTEMVYMNANGWNESYGSGPNKALTRCPDHTYADRDNSYVWIMQTDITRNPPDAMANLLFKELKEQGSAATAVMCDHHDIAYYAPTEQDVAPKVRKPFLIQLKFDGSIHRGRVNKDGKPL